MLSNGWYHKKYHRFQSLHCSGDALFCPWINASHCTDSTYSYVGKWVFLCAQQVSCDGITVLLQYIIVPFGVFGKEQTSRISPKAFSDRIVLTAQKKRRKQIKLWVGLKIGPTTFQTKILPVKHSRQNTKCLVIDLSVLNVCNSNTSTLHMKESVTN